MLDVSGENSTRHQQLFSPIDRTLFLGENLLTCHLTCVMIGIPANLFVVGLIIGTKRLRNPRTFIWLGVGFANILLLCYQLIEFVATCWPSQETMQLADWILGLPHLNQHMSTLIPIIERHLCLRYPNWHRRNVTNRRILSVQVGSLIILCLFVKGHQLYGELGLTLTLSGLGFVINSCSVGFIVCLAIHFFFSTTFSRTYPPAIGLRHPPILLLSNSPFVHIEDERVSRLNVKAARSSMMGGLFLLAFTAPALTYFAVFGLNSCLSSTGPTGCIERFQFFVYLTELVPIYCTFISPTFFVSTSHDILSVLRDRVLDDDLQ